VGSRFPLASFHHTIDRSENCHESARPCHRFPRPALVAAAGARASYCFLEFFTAQIRNPHTRRAYARAATEFFDWL
jgi:hypothetical protein